MNDLQSLKQVTEAAYQVEQAKLRDILTREAELRRDLAALAKKLQTASCLPPEQLAAPRAIGADLLWQGWIQRNRQDLNVQLAQVLVAKAEKMSALTRAFGRAEAVETLLNNQKTARRKDALDRAQRATEDLTLLQNYIS